MEIGLLGTGLMGRAMAKRLLDAGYPVTVYNRTKEKALALEPAGARVSDTPGAVIGTARCVITVLSDYHATRAVLVGDDAGRDFTGRTVIQMGTISPAESIGLEREIAGRGGSYIESPVLGSRSEVAQGRLILMVGSSEQRFEQWRPLLATFGPEPLHVGEVGKAAALKLAMNQLIAGLTVTFSQSLAYIRSAGVDVDQFMAVTRNSALYAPTFDKKLQRMLAGDFTDPNFPAKHMAKDVRLLLDEVIASGGNDIDTKAIEAFEQLFIKAVQRGLGDSDYSSVYAVVAAVNAG